MRKLVEIIAAVSIASLWFINALSGVISAVWLIALGEWGIVLLGFILTMVMPFFYSLAILPTMILLPLINKAAEKGNKFWVGILGFIVGFYEKFITGIWITSIFGLMSMNDLPLFPAILYGYTIAVSPLGWMAQKEGTNAGLGTTFGLLFAQISYLTLALAFVFTGNQELGYLLVWFYVFIFTIIGIALGVASVEKPQKKSYLEEIAALGDLESKTSDLENEYTLIIDPLIPQVITHLYKGKHTLCSASYIQRSFAVSFDRATNIRDELVELGALEKTENSKPNPVLITTDEHYNTFMDLLEKAPKKDLEIPVLSDVAEYDDLYEKSVEFVKRHKEISGSTVQKHFEIGFLRMSRFMGKMQEDGIIEQLEPGHYKVIQESEVTYCSDCGKNIDINAKFCKYCGNPVA